MTYSLSRAYCQIARSAAPRNPTSPTWVEPGYKSASAGMRRAARFSSKRSLLGVSASGNAHQPALPLRCIGEASANVVRRQLGEIGEDLFFAHARCEIR